MWIAAHAPGHLRRLGNRRFADAPSGDQGEDAARRLSSGESGGDTSHLAGGYCRGARDREVGHRRTAVLAARSPRDCIVRRVRSDIDRRRVHVEATEACDRLLENSPPLLQEQFAKRFDALEEWEQTLMLSTLQRVATMMDARDLSVSPVLTPGPVTAPPEMINDMEDSAISPQDIRDRKK